MSFGQAWELERAGKTNEAFAKYLAVPGGEFAAATLARRDSGGYLDQLSNDPAILDSPRMRLVQADLLVSLGRKQEAREIYHSLAANYDVQPRVEDIGDYYSVELPIGATDDDPGRFVPGRFGRSELALPFKFGPGSHRDNWLLRRLIAADLKEDAAKEFARIWEVHHGFTQPYVVTFKRHVGKDVPPREEKMLVRPCGFSSLGLQFALDYSYFLKRHGDTNNSRAVLLEALRLANMDCDPNFPGFEPLVEAVPPLPLRERPLTQMHSTLFRGSVGTSREDFIRLVYGEFKGADREDELISTLQENVAFGTNQTRRVLALIRRHQGQADDALALELDFIAHAGFDVLTAACRRGVAFEEYQRMTNAAAEYESALNISSTLPEIEQKPLVTYSVRDRLTRLYAGQGRMEKVLAMELAQFEANEARVDDFGQVEQLQRRFVGAGRAGDFEQWAQAKLDATKRPVARANLAWQLGDYQTAAEEAAHACNRGRSTGFLSWLERFETLGPGHYQAFLASVVDLYPDDVQSRLDLLEAKSELHSPAAAACYEDMLQHPERGYWSFYPSRLRYPRNPVEVAARLARIYESMGRLDSLRALGLQLAQRKPPFAEFERNIYFYHGDNGRDEFLNATLGLAIQYADDKEYQNELVAALKTSPWNAALAQLERRMAHEAGTKGATPMLPAVKWVNVPEGVQLFVSCENVRSLANDDQFVYAGQPWGFSVYDFTGQLVECVALGEPVTAMVVGSDGIWAATPSGLFRLQRSSTGWNIALQAGRQTRWPDGRTTTYAINALVLRGDELWMADSPGCRMLNVRTLEISSYSNEELVALQPQPFPQGEEDAVKLTLQNGTRVFGRGMDMDIPPFWHLHANRDESEGGLFFISTAGVTNRVSSAPHSNILAGDSVFKIFPVEDDWWLCTSLGVARMNKEFQIVEWFSRKDGLLGNVVTSGAEMGGRIYFGCCWDWSGGGLAVFDPATEVFTSFERAAGMDANRVEDLATAPDGKLQITYAGETWMNQNPNYRRSPPGLFDPQTRRFQSGGPPQAVSQTEGWRLRFEWNKQTPFLGGPLIRKIPIAEKTYYCGARGMAVVHGTNTDIEFANLGAVEIPSFDDRMRAAALAFDLQGWTSPEGVLKGLDHTNRFLRARIISTLRAQPKERLNDYLAALDKALDDSYACVCDNAVQLLARVEGKQALLPLKHALKHSRLEIRVLAAYELAKRGEVPPLSILEEWLKRGDDHLSMWQGCDIFNVLQISTPASIALARIGSMDAAALCLKYPAAMNHTFYRPVLAAAWGESVRRHPNIAGVWLTARGRDPKTRWPLPPLVREVFQSAGKDVLPKLHQALTSTNRVIRSNAARACGAIADPSSIPHLLAALDLESGLSRASIVWALGELRATEAVPQLFTLYTETSSSPSRPRSGVGFLASQSGDAYSAQYAGLQDLNAIAEEWEELSYPHASLSSADADDDELLSVDHVLDAVRKIGPGSTQEFYRKLAGSARDQDRVEAAAELAKGDTANLEANRPILRSLRSDPHGGVVVVATISLLTLGEPGMNAALRARLASPSNDERALVLDQLARLQAGQLEFARKEIEAIAGDERQPLYLRYKAQALQPKLGRPAQ